MLIPSSYLIITAFLITLEFYRIPVGYNITFYHISLGLALFTGALAFFSRKLKLEIDGGVRVILIILFLFESYSFVSFMRNIGEMAEESKATYLAELVGYFMALLLPLFLCKRQELERVVKAFLASAVFVYLGAFWHSYNFVVLGQYVREIPLWREYTKSELVLEYIEDAARFGGFPRFRIPFSSPAGTGIFLSLVGILLLTYTIHLINNKRRRAWILIPLNLINLFCLLGTFARASWVVFFVGSLFTVWYFRKLDLIDSGKITLMLLVSVGLFFALLSLTPFGEELLHMVGLRLKPEVTRVSDIGHLASRGLALQYWEESPITGLGIGGFFGKPMGEIHTHSTYFTVLVDRGLIGLILFIFFLYQVYRVLKGKIRLSWECNNKIMVSYNIAFLGGLVGLLVGMFLYEMECEVVWLFFGMMLACINLSSKMTRDVSEYRRGL